jgi:hypothetical protein
MIWSAPAERSGDGALESFVIAFVEFKPAG